MKIPLVKNTIDNQDIDKLIEWLQTYPRLTKGELTVKFEEEWSKFIGTRYSVFVNSGSSANLLMLYTLIETGKIKKGDTVVVPAVSWATDLAPVVQLGLNPILCDCNLEDLSVDLHHLEEIYKKNNPAAVIIVSILGLVPQMDKVLDLCQNDIPIFMICPMGFRLNNKRTSKRLIKLKTIYPDITTIISLPLDTFDKTLYHCEIVCFNTNFIKPHYQF